jgi:hypothetical protein
VPFVLSVKLPALDSRLDHPLAGVISIMDALLDDGFSSPDSEAELVQMGTDFCYRPALEGVETSDDISLCLPFLVGV